MLPQMLCPAAKLVFFGRARGSASSFSCFRRAATRSRLALEPSTEVSGQRRASLGPMAVGATATAQTLIRQFLELMSQLQLRLRPPQARTCFLDCRHFMKELVGFSGKNCRSPLHSDCFQGSGGRTLEDYTAATPSTSRYHPVASCSI